MRDEMDTWGFLEPSCELIVAVQPCFPWLLAVTCPSAMIDPATHLAPSLPPTAWAPSLMLRNLEPTGTSSDGLIWTSGLNADGSYCFAALTSDRIWRVQSSSLSLITSSGSKYWPWSSSPPWRKQTSSSWARLAMLVPLEHRLSSDSEATSTLVCRFVLPRWANFCFTAAERFSCSVLLWLDVTQQMHSFGFAVLTPLPPPWLLFPPSPLPRGDRSARSTTPDTALVCPALMSSVVLSQARLHIVVGLPGCKSGRWVSSPSRRHFCNTASSTFSDDLLPDCCWISRTGLSVLVDGNTAWSIH